MLLPKPDDCIGCPLYGDGLGYVPDKMRDGAPVLIMGQGPGPDEEAGRRVVELYPHEVREKHPHEPFIGKTGYSLNTKFLPMAGLERKDVSLGNTLRCRLKVGGKRVNDMPTGDTLRDAVDHCTSRYLRIPESTRVIVAQGSHAWRALGGEGKPIREWRGYVLPEVQLREGSLPVRTPAGVPVFGTVHLADLFREPDMVFPTEQDFRKIPLILKGEWPKPHPKSHAYTEWDYEVQDWFDRALRDAPWVCIDGEWPEGRLSLLGLGYPGSSILQWSNPSPDDTRFTQLLQTLLRSKRIVYWNAKADIPVMGAALGLGWESHHQGWDDPMQLHSVLWTELGHDLESVASIYSDFNKRKHLKHTHPLLYNAGDVADTISIAIALFAELGRLPRCRQRYQDRLDILPIVSESEQRGIAVDAKTAEEKVRVVRSRVGHARDIAQAAVGYPINIGSADQLRVELYDIEGHARKKKKKTAAPTVDNDAVAAMRTLYLPFDPLYEEREGLRPEYILDRIRLGAHPLLEARALFSANDYVDTHYLSKLVNVSTVHHNIEIHTQDNYRWSYTNPPLATFEEELRSIFIPYKGWPWKGWDKEGIELRLIACEARSEWLIQALLDGWDIHTLTACDVFQLPQPPVPVNPTHSPDCAAWRLSVGWKECDHARDICGKSDPRRGFGKNFRYRRNYGGRPESALDIPGATQLGLTAPILMAAALQMDVRDPDTARWWRDMDRDVERTRAVWDFAGSLRRLHARNADRRRRQAYDFPMQAGTQSIMDREFLAIKKRFGTSVYFVYGAHDSNIWAIEEKHVEQVERGVEEIVSSEYVINGVRMPFPASFKPMRYGDGVQASC